MLRSLWAAEQQTGNLHVLPCSLATLHQASGTSPGQEALDWAQISVRAQRSGSRGISHLEVSFYSKIYKIPAGKFPFFLFNSYSNSVTFSESVSKFRTPTNSLKHSLGATEYFYPRHEPKQLNYQLKLEREIMNGLTQSDFFVLIAC